jgi:hypothetical protein
MTPVSAIVPRHGERGLGGCVMRHQSRSRDAAIALVAGALTLCVWAALSIGLAVTSGRAATASILLFAALLVPVAAFAIRRGTSQEAVTITLHEHGITRHDRDGELALAWSEIAGVSERVDEHDGLFGRELRGAFTFSAHDGRRLIVDADVSAWREIGRRASEAAQSALTASYDLALLSRRRIAFGGLALDAYAVYTAEGAIPWNAVSFVRFDRHGPQASWAIHVSAWGVAARVANRDVSNAQVFVRVLERLGKLEVPAATILAAVSDVAAAE